MKLDCSWEKKKLSCLFSFSAAAWITLQWKSSHESLENAPKRVAETSRRRGTQGVLHFRVRPVAGWTNQSITLHSTWATQGPFIATPISFRL